MHTPYLHAYQGSSFPLSDVFEPINANSSVTYNVWSYDAPYGSYFEEGTLIHGMSSVQYDVRPEEVIFHVGAYGADYDATGFRVETVDRFGFITEENFTFHLTMSPASVSNEGTEVSERFLGTSGHDFFDGLGGDDNIQGGAGHDHLHGGAGSDFIHGGDGNDTLYGDSGHDFLYGEAGDDRLYGGDGHDLLMGHDGNDLLEGGKGNDTLFGMEGDDHLYGGLGDDRLDGGNGDDVLRSDSGNNTLYGGPCDDAFVITPSATDEEHKTLIHGDALGWGGIVTHGHDIIQLLGMDQGPSESSDGEGSWTVCLTDNTTVVPEPEAHHVMFPEETSGNIAFFGGDTITFHEINEIQW